MAYKQRGQQAKAIAKLKAAIVERDDYAQAHLSLGILYRQLTKTNKAIHHLERAAKLQPSSGQALYSLGIAYNQAGRRKEALAALEKAAAVAPKNAQLVAALGALLRRSDPERALRYLQQATKLKPNEAEHWHQLGVGHRQAAVQALKQKNKALYAQHMKDAEKNLLVSLRMKEGNARLHFDLGVLYRRLGQRNKAIRHYERAVALDPKLASAYWELGHVYKQNKQPEEAVQAFQKYIDLRGGSSSAGIAKKRIEEIKGKK